MNLTNTFADRWMGVWCLSVCQRYNLKANHNGVGAAVEAYKGVYQCVKDTIWKQITTLECLKVAQLEVFISVSKIQFESKSQPDSPLTPTISRCLSVCQRYNLKANHNASEPVIAAMVGVYQCVKDTIWKQITTGSWSSHPRKVVFISVSKIQFESKSQLILIYDYQLLGCLSVCQRYNLKANHNHVDKSHPMLTGVYQCVKDTIWKQITTESAGNFIQLKVFISVSKIQFESKSQRWFEGWQLINRCLSVCQRYNLKANHNTAWAVTAPAFGVYQCVKDTIWKQITTNCWHKCGKY